MIQNERKREHVRTRKRKPIDVQLDVCTRRECIFRQTDRHFNEQQRKREAEGEDEGDEIIDEERRLHNDFHLLEKQASSAINIISEGIDNCESSMLVVSRQWIDDGVNIVSILCSSASQAH